MEFEEQYIKCSKFQDTEAVIKKAEDKIKETKSIKERQYYAQDILLEAKALISCSNYDSNTGDCLNCHLILLRYIQQYKHLADNVIKNPLVN